MSVANPSFVQRFINAGYYAYQGFKQGVISNRSMLQKGTVDDYGITHTRPLGITGKQVAGVWVDHDEALTMSAIWGCANVIAQDIGVVNWHVLQEELSTGNKTRRRDVQVAPLLRHQPNDEMSAQTFKEALTVHCLFFGNAYAEIQRDRAGQPYALWPMLPDRTKPARNPADGKLYYLTYVDGEWWPIPAADVFHLRGLGFNGLVGYDVISYMAGTIGTGIAAQTYSANFFGNGTHMSGGLFSKKKLSPEARDHLREEFEKVYRGPGNAFKMAVYEEDMEWKSFSVSPEAARVIETRKHEVREVCRWFRVKPHKIGDLEDATYSNIEQESEDHIGDTILPWAVRWEMEGNRKLLTDAQKKTLFTTKMNVNALKRGDLKSQSEAFQMGREWGWLSANDVRRMLDMNEIGAVGDVYLVPLNFQNAEDMLLPLEEREARREENNERQTAANAIRPLARQAVERILTRESHRVKELFDLSLDDSEQARRLADIMSKQKDYAVNQLTPVISSCLYVLFPDDGTVPVMVNTIVEPIVTRYVVRHTERWRNHDAGKGFGVEKSQVTELLDDLFEHTLTEAHNYGLQQAA